MAEEKETTVRVTVDLPESLHEAFSRMCFLSKPKLRMNRVIEGLVREWVAKGEAGGKKGRS